MSETLIAALRKAADWGEDEFDVLSPQDAAAAADRIEALERELGWQPIETAPKDGTPILLFARCKTATAPVILVGWHLPNEGWIESSFTGPVGVVPTHWRPLPPRTAESLRFGGDSAQAAKGFRGNGRRNAAGTGAESPEISQNLSPPVSPDGHRAGVA